MKFIYCLLSISLVSCSIENKPTETVENKKEVHQFPDDYLQHVEAPITWDTLPGFDTLNASKY
jgi:hypothetical protein